MFKKFQIILLLCVGFPAAAVAAVITVPGDQPTIQAGIDAAFDGDIVQVADGTFTGATNRNLRFHGKSITVHSENGYGACIIDCEGAGRAFVFDGGENAESLLEGFTILNSFDSTGQGGAILCSGSSPTISGNLISGCQDTLAGGGIGCHNASPAILGNTISGNSAGWFGGAISCLALSSPRIENNILTNNEAGSFGGAVYCAENSDPQITGNSISGNSVTFGGGGIYAEGASPTITDNEIVENRITGQDYSYGGGIYCSEFFSEISGNIINNNVISYRGHGGGVYCYQSTLTIRDNQIMGNTIAGSNYGYGGGIYCHRCYGEITENTILKNEITASNYPRGGGIYSSESSTTISGNIINSNALGTSGSYYDCYGGGIYFNNDESRVEGNTISRNRLHSSDDGFGGGIYCIDSSPRITGNIITENLVSCGDECYGGGIYCDDELPVIFDNTITGNTLDGDDCFGGGIYSSYASPVISANTISGNISNGSVSCSGGGIYCRGEESGHHTRIINNLIEDNEMSAANSRGGGLFSLLTILELSGNTISGHHVRMDGGGIYFTDQGYYDPAIITSNIITGNTADGDGGGIFTDIDALEVENCLITGNSALRGGGVYSDDMLMIFNSTLSDNAADFGGGLYCNGELSIADSIVWMNTNGQFYVTSSIPEARYSDIEGGYPGEGNIDVDPLFVPGPTGQYYLSQVAAGEAEDSPCVNAGSSAVENFGLGNEATRTDQVADDGIVDMGYHYPPPSRSIAVNLNCRPVRGTLPFETDIQISLINKVDFPRTFSARIDLTLGNGNNYSNWRSGWTNLAAGEIFTTDLNQPIPSLSTLVGTNIFNLVAEDVTASPYNQPPYPPSGDSDTDAEMVQALVGTMVADLNCVPLSGTLPFTGEHCANLANRTPYPRRFAYRVRADYADGYYNYIQTGYIDVAPGATGEVCWDQFFPEETRYMGENLFTLFARDVTQPPYNYPPYAPSGNTDTSTCTVEGWAPLNP